MTFNGIQLKSEGRKCGEERKVANAAACWTEYFGIVWFDGWGLHKHKFAPSWDTTHDTQYNRLSQLGLSLSHFHFHTPSLPLSIALFCMSTVAGSITGRRGMKTA